MMKSIALLVIAILVVNVVVISVSLMRQTSRLTKAGTDVVNLEREVSTLTGDMVTLRNNASNLQAKLTESETKAVTLQAALGKANADVVKALANANNQTTNNLTNIPAFDNGHSAGVIR